MQKILAACARPATVGSANTTTTYRKVWHMHKQTIIDSLNASSWHAVYLQAIQNGSDSPEADADLAMQRGDEFLDSLGANEQI